MKLREIAEKLSSRVEGDGSIEITGLAPIEDAKEGDLSFLANSKYYPYAKTTRASALIVGEDFPAPNVPVIRNKNPYLTFAMALNIFNPPPLRSPSIHPTAWISATAKLGEDASVGAYSFIGENVLIGDRVSIGTHCSVHEGVSLDDESVLHSGCVIREGVRIGRRVVIHDNAVVGSDGFGYAKRDDGSWHKIIQAGTVVIEDDVEIGAGTTIDRSALGETRVGPGTKIDNLVQIGHSCQIGRDGLICAQVGLAGTTKVGANVILAGQVGAAGHLTIGDGVIATPQTGIPSSVKPNLLISGSPSFDHKAWLKSSAVFPRLPELKKTLRSLEQRVLSLEMTLKNLPEK